MLRRTNTTKELTWCVILQAGNDTSVTWHEFERDAEATARDLLTDCKDANENATVWVCKAHKQGGVE